MKHFEKYGVNYFMPPTDCYDWVKKDRITKPPVWCSVDLRDGNQALIIPMSLEQKLEFFSYLVKIGFKEIEVGFPAASDTEFEFLRALIERDLVPDDVTVQVLTQSREHIIKKTFDALRGVKNAVVHLYNSTSVAQREQVFRKSREEIVDIAVSGAKLVKQYAATAEGNLRFEYSPESFTGTEPEFALDICNAVLDVWEPNARNKVIINLPSTVQLSMPHVFASQVEYMSKNLKCREHVVLSVHPHNDRGTGVADAELGVLAGADRVEGTLFGNGERTGNVDIVTMAVNLFSHGVDPGLAFNDIPEVTEVYERMTNMKVSQRHPYSGELVFTAFSGSHQDAIAKGMHYREEHASERWTVPYLAIDPKDVGRNYDGDVIRINSQSGKGGISYLMEQKYGFHLPLKMREDFGYCVKAVSDQAHKELLPEEVKSIFFSRYVNIALPISLKAVRFHQNAEEFSVDVLLCVGGADVQLSGKGNGRLDAVANAMRERFQLDFSLTQYHEHALEQNTTSQAAAYVCLSCNGQSVWGAGVDTDIITASIRALISSVNRILQG